MMASRIAWVLALSLGVSLMPHAHAKPGAPLIDFAPRDTAYAIGTVKRAPEATMKAIIERMGPAWEEMMEAVSARVAEEAPPEERAKVNALFAEIPKKLDEASWRRIGLRMNMHMAIYGVGLLPVIRLELADGAAFRATIGRVAKALGETLPVRKHKKAEYWAIGDKDFEIAVAVLGDQLVVAFYPPKVRGKLLGHALASRRPKKGLRPKTLTAIAREHGFLEFMSGFVDFHSVAKTLMGRARGLHGAVWKALKIKGKRPSKVCRREIRGLIDKAPRAVFGYDRLDAKEMNAAYVLELAGSVAHDLLSIRGAVPGLGGRGGGHAISFGVAVQPMAALDLAREYAARVTAKPYKCSDLEGLNSAAKELVALDVSRIPPILGSVRGFLAAATSLDMDALRGSGPNALQALKGWIVVATTQPDVALAMARGMIPGLGALVIQDGGDPVLLPEGVLPSPVTALAARRGNAIGMSFGEGTGPALVRALSAKAPAHSPLLSLSYDLKTLMGSMMKEVEEGLVADAAGGGNAAMDRETQQMLDIMRPMTDLMGAVGYSVRPTRRGLRVDSFVQLTPPSP